MHENGIPFMEIREEEATTAAHEDVPEDIQMPTEILTYDMKGNLCKYVATMPKSTVSTSLEHPFH